MTVVASPGSNSPTGCRNTSSLRSIRSSTSNAARIGSVPVFSTRISIDAGRSGPMIELGTAMPAMRQDGLSFLTGRVWDPNTGQHGIAAEIWGTLYTSILALVIGSAFGVAAALFLSEGYMGQAIFSLLRVFNLHLHPFWSKVPDELEDLLKQLIELLAAIPSVVYGLWGLFVVIPLIRPACNWLHMKLGWMAKGQSRPSV